MQPQRPIPIGGHTLPPLPYATSALEPIIGAETLEIHHGKHHRKYVDDLNAAELGLLEARKAGNFSAIGDWERRLAFNGSGHILHSLYWSNMTAPGSGGSPGTYTAAHLSWSFGGLEAFMAQFTAAASTAEGSGWAILGYNTAFRRLEVLQCEKHQNLTQWGIIPLLVCDVWEHAYYLDYRNSRTDYIGRWWSLVNWPDVENRFIAAGMGRLPLERAGESAI